MEQKYTEEEIQAMKEEARKKLGLDDSYRMLTTEELVKELEPMAMRNAEQSIPSVCLSSMNNMLILSLLGSLFAQADNPSESIGSFFSTARKQLPKEIEKGLRFAITKGVQDMQALNECYAMIIQTKEHEEMVERVLDYACGMSQDAIFDMLNSTEKAVRRLVLE